ncbi:hypothetical protein [Phytoactinopolyspora endophytica]|uniref:hypothetical protein n=1 Tax=Phytoactinopolyspora endophytica TaxID=1642495 RepID=UPI00197B49E1|nr:hypothetical protein [Phytoactinopolyspora endophytica]
MPTRTTRIPRTRAIRRDARIRTPHRRLLTAAIGLPLIAGGSLALATPASAASATGPEGQSVTVSKADDLNQDGETITVEGSGFDLDKGIYVVLCVNNGAGQAPSPCLGGVDMEGAGGSSAWISSNPPSYGEGLAQPFDEVDGEGSFSVQLQVSAQDEFTDCLDESAAPDGCVVGTRADHTRTGDRSADVLIPVSFGTAGSGGDTSGGNEADGDGSGDAGAEAGDSNDAEGSDDAAGSDNAAESDAGSGSDDGAASGGDGPDGADDGADGAASGTADGEVDSADDLATTGVPAMTAVVGAAALLAAGAALVVARRRPSTHP